MKTNNKILITFLFTVSLLLSGCKDYDPISETGELPPAISFDKSTDLFEIAPNGLVYELKVQSTNTANVNRDVIVSINNDATTALPVDYILESTSITIPAGSLIGSTSITFDPSVLNYGDYKNIVLDLELTGDDIYNTSRKQTDISYVKKCPFNTVTLSLSFDSWSEETSWDIKDVVTNQIVASGSYGAGESSATEILCLENGTYLLTMHDSYGDGICCGGSYLLSGPTNTYASGGSFGFSESTAFTLGN